MTVSDERLFEQLVAGDVAAFDVLYSRYETHLFGFIRAHLHDVHEAEDVLHETFMSLLKVRKQPQLTSFRAWVFQVARNACLNRSRSKRRGDAALQQVPFAVVNPPADEPHAALEHHQRAQALESAVRTLPADLGQLYHLRAKGLSYAELAEVFAVPLGTIKSRLHELVRRLKEDLES